MKKILVVDDSELNIIFVSMILEKNYIIQTALSGKEALQKIYTDLPDLIILDIVMEDISGLNVCKEIKNNAKTAHIPIIFLTATYQSFIDKGYEVGADEFLSKPVKPQLLKEKVKQLLQRPVIKKISYN